MKKTLIKVLAGLVCLLLTKAQAQTVSDLLRQGVSVHRAVIPLYPAGSFKLSAVVRVDRAHVDYQRKGFFRIGLLPIVVLEGVTFDARDAADPVASLSCIRHWLGTKAGQRIEMHDVKFYLSPTNSLEAGSAHCASEAQWDLLDGVRFISSVGEIRAPRASLEMSGPRVGRVILETTPRSTTVYLATPQTTLHGANNSLMAKSHICK